jgi:hypothetical protein
MVNMPSSPPPINPNAPQGPQQPEDNAQVPGKGFKAKPLEFLGMYFNSEEATKLWQSVIQLVNREIEKDKAKSIKAIKNFSKDQDDQE